MKNTYCISLLLFLAAIFSAGTSLGQNTTYKLSDYKNPDYFYQALNLNFSMNSGLNLFKNTYSYDNSLNSYSINSNAGATYSSSANSAKSQTERYLSIGAGMGSSGNRQRDYFSQETREQKDSQFNHNEQLNISGLKRFYNEKQNYFEVSASLLSGYNGRSTKNKTFNFDTISTSTQSKAQAFGNTVAGAFLIGKGRIEQVQDARLALYLLDDLHRLNRDSRPATDEEVNELARLITSLKYKRFFDYRLRTIAEITAIDSFLQNKHIAGTADAAYFTSLNDNWLFANNPARQSGRRIFTGIEAAFHYYKNKNDEQDLVANQSISAITDKQQDGSIYLVAGLNYEKPLNLIWQKSANLKIGIGSGYQLQNYNQSKINNDIDFDSFRGRFPSVKLQADYGYDYYPTSRTWLSASWQLSAYWEKIMQGTSRKDKEDFMNDFRASTGPQVSAYYYLSEKLRLNFSFYGEFLLAKSKYTQADLSQYSSRKTTTTSWKQTINAGLSYSLF